MMTGCPYRNQAHLRIFTYSRPLYCEVVKRVVVINNETGHQALSGIPETLSFSELASHFPRHPLVLNLQSGGYVVIYKLPHALAQPASSHLFFICFSSHALHVTTASANTTTNVTSNSTTSTPDAC